MLRLPDHPLIVITGKGGTGKSTVAAALAIAAAHDGRRVILAEVGAQNRLSSALGGGESSLPPLTEREISDGLSHISIDPDAMIGEYLHDQLPKPVAILLARNRAFSALAVTVPGLRELLTIGKAWELAQDERRRADAQRYELVIVDAPASGHGLGLLTAAGTFAQTARGGPLARHAAQIDAMIGDRQRTAVIAVCTPDELAVNETLELAVTLSQRLPSQRLAAIVVNGLKPRRFSVAERDLLTAAADALSADDPRHRPIADAATDAAAAIAQRQQITTLRRNLLPDSPPLATLRRRLTDGPLSEHDLGALARELVLP